MEQTIYKVYSFESNEWVECDKYTYDKTEDKYRDWEAVSIPEPFRQPNRFDLMSETEKAITNVIGFVEDIGASEHLTNAVIKLGQARDLVYEHYRNEANK
jgi:hypothetical protein